MLRGTLRATEMQREQGPEGTSQTRSKGGGDRTQRKREKARERDAEKTTRKRLSQGSKTQSKDKSGGVRGVGIALSFFSSLRWQLGLLPALRIRTFRSFCL